MTDNFNAPSALRPRVSLPNLVLAPEDVATPLPTIIHHKSRQPTPPPSPVRYLYYQIFGSTSTLPSKRAFDPHDNTKGRVLARTIPPARTAATVKRYIARLEGFDPSQVDAIYPDAQSNRPIPDDAPIAALEGCPGTTVWSPLAISVREPRNESPTSSPSPMMLPAMSLVLSPSSFLEMDSPPPSPRISPLPEIPSSTEAQIRPLNQLTSPISPTSPKSSISPLSPSTYDSPKSPGQATFVYPPTSDPRWTIGKDGFAEPTESLTEAFKVVSHDQPPGWLRGIVQCIGFGGGIFMGKLGKKHGNTLQGGTVVQDGMRVWVDGRQMKGVTIRTGDKFSTYRIIFEDTREMTYLWTGDISIDRVQS